jgi:hypothetical protein
MANTEYRREATESERQTFIDESTNLTDIKIRKYRITHSLSHIRKTEINEGKQGW